MKIYFAIILVFVFTFVTFGQSNEPQNIGSLVVNGKPISLPKPKYPAKARQSRASGGVIVQATVDESGKVVSAKAINGDPLLFEAAEKAARKAKFKPYLLNGSPVSVTGVITYSFMPN